MLQSTRIGITLGDPCGIGPVLTARALARWPDLRVFGNAQGFEPGRPDLRSATAQVQWLEEAARAAQQGELDALVTAPISKLWAKRAGFAFPGQTEFLAARLGVSEFAMMMAAPNLRVVLATTHVALRDLAQQLTGEKIERAIRLACRSLQQDFAIASPRLGVCGLNPHAGEGGLLGREEIELVEPAIANMRDQVEATLVGPLAPDTAFAPVHNPPFDGIVALYHDQGLIPIKALAFDQAVNVTLGLPIVRTSPDHGVAYDLAAQSGAVRESSMLAAIELARDIAARRLP